MTAGQAFTEWELRKALWLDFTGSDMQKNILAEYGLPKATFIKYSKDLLLALGYKKVKDVQDAVLSTKSSVIPN